MMTEFTPEFIASELEKAKKATLRPWNTWYGLRGISIANNAAKDKGLTDCPDDICCFYDEGDELDGTYPNAKNNSDYIVSSANCWEDALKEIENLRTINRNMKEQLDVATELGDKRWKALNDIYMSLIKMVRNE